MLRQLAYTIPLAAVVVAHAVAQCPQWTTSFAGPGPADSVRALLEFDDGSGTSLFVGGAFTVAGDVAANRVARWNGSTWSPLGSGADSFVNVLCASSADGSLALYAGGLFANAGGSPAARVARWDGAAWSALGAGLDDEVETLVEFDDGGGAALFAGGRFTLAGSNTANHVARWRNGAWSALGSGLAARVHALAVHDDGSGARLYAAGPFSGGVAVWDGANWTTVGAGLAGNIDALASFATAGSPLLYAGREDALGQSALYAWNGSSWSSAGSASNRVVALAVVDESSGPALWVGGAFYTDRFDGSTWNHFFADQFVQAFAAFGAGAQRSACAGGRFQRIVDEPCDYLAAWNAGSWSALGPPQRAFDGDASVRPIVEWTPPATQRSLAVVGGNFERVGGIAAQSVAAWDGVTWTSLGNGLPGSVNDLVVIEDPALGGPALVAAGFLDVDANWNGDDLARWDGSSWTPIAGVPAHPISALRHAVVFHPGSGSSEQLVVAGGIDTATAHQIASWDGTSWSNMNGGLNLSVSSLAVYDPPGATPEGVYAGGQFTTAGGAPASTVVRWDGTSWSNVPGLPMTTIRSMVVHDDGSGPTLYACNESDSYIFKYIFGLGWDTLVLPSTLESTSNVLASFDDGGGSALYFGERWRWRGGVWSIYNAGSFNTSTATVLGFELGSPFGRALVFGGSFTQIGSVGAGRIARWSDPCAALTSYCTAKVNSQGCSPAIGWNGEPSLSASAMTPFEITASNVLNNKSGILFYGVFGRTAVPFQGGVNCVHSPVHRTPLRSSGGNVGPDDCSGVYTIDFTPWIDGTNDALLDVGVTVDAQWWSRDPAIASTTGLTNAIEFEIRP